MAQTTYIPRKGQDADFAAVTATSLAASAITMADDEAIALGTSSDVTIEWDTAATPDELQILPAADDTVLGIGKAAATQLAFDIRWLANEANGASSLYFDASANLLAMGGTNFKLETIADTMTVRLNSRNYAASSGDIIGFQSKPRANATGTATVYGAQISPGFNDAVAGATLVGLQADVILKGTSGNLSGDVRGIQSQITDENAAGRTIGGTISNYWAWQQLAAHTTTGGVFVMHCPAPGGAKAYSGFLKADASGAGGVIVGAMTAKNPENDAEAGYISIYVGSTRYEIPFYAVA